MSSCSWEQPQPNEQYKCVVKQFIIRWQGFAHFLFNTILLTNDWGKPVLLKMRHWREPYVGRLLCYVMILALMVNPMRMQNHPCIPLRNYVVFWSAAWHGFAKLWSSLFMFPPLIQNWFLMWYADRIWSILISCSLNPLAMRPNYLKCILVLCRGYSSVGSWAWLLVHGFCIFIFTLRWG